MNKWNKDAQIFYDKTVSKNIITLDSHNLHTCSDMSHSRP